MPRMPRESSATGIYHIMLRGIDKREIFISNSDNERFLSSVQKAMELGKFRLLGYCLMRNHAHLLVEEGEENIGSSIKRITCSYVQWHNSKYARVGHLFQNRFRSEPVHNEAYLLRVLRYIHQNPVKANICEKAQQYQWSSYKSYIDSYGGKKGFVNTDIYMDYFRTKQSFEIYMNEAIDDECLDYEDNNKYTDEELIQRIKFHYNINDFSQLKRKDQLYDSICNIYHETGVSIRQLSRVTGVGKAIIEKSIKLSGEKIKA